MRGPDPEPVSAELGAWLDGGEERTLGTLIATFGSKSFALLFILLLALPALPLPTGGATHVFELIAMLLALELIAGVREIWLPARWRALRLTGPRRERLIAALLRLIRRLERISRPRLRFLFGSRVSNAVFGVLVLGVAGVVLEIVLANAAIGGLSELL